jgi:hypothetical protein
MVREPARFMIGVTGVFMLLGGLALTLPAVAAPWRQQSRVEVSRPLSLRHEAPDEAGRCTQLQIEGDVRWFAVDEDGNVDVETVVDEYDDSTPAIAPGFEYSCVPKNTTIVSVFTLQQMDVIGEYATETKRLAPSDRRGVFVQPLEGDIPYGMCEGCDAGPDDGPRLPVGRYEVEFYLNEELLVSGETTVGDVGNVETGWVTVRGKVRDDRTHKPIRGANVVILKPGVRFDDWIDDTDDDRSDTVYTHAVTDLKGLFALDNPLEREVAYTLVSWGSGYRGFYSDDFVIAMEDPDPLEITLDLARKE